MAYSDFSFIDLAQQFGIKNQRDRLFATVEKVQPTAKLIEDLAEIEELPIRSEKAKSEWIVVPILKELRKRNNKFFTIYSGDILNADIQKGLNGECDFILSKDIKSFDINYPIIQVVEAKRHDLEAGVAQCAAQLVGAKVFNERQNVEIAQLYGCVTIGTEWLFLKLEDNVVTVDSKIYFLNQLDELLGVLQHIITYYRQTLA